MQTLGVYDTFYFSIVTFDDAYVSYVIPKTGYNESSKSYFVTVTVCVIIPKPGNFNFEVKTTLNDLNVPDIFKVVNFTTLDPYHHKKH